MGGDISNSTTLDRVLKTRASDSGEIIAALTDATRLKFAVNLLLNMEELDLHHHLVLTSSQVTCDALWRRTHRLSQLSVGCAYSSFLRRSDGHGGGDDGGGGDGSGGSAGGSNRLAGYSGTISTSTRQRRIEMGLDAYGFTDDHVYHLWWLRWDFLSRAVGAGYRCLLLDTDVSLRANPYPILHDVLAKHALVSGLGDDQVSWPLAFPDANVGLVYARGPVGGGAHWVVSEVARRLELLLRGELLGWPRRRGLSQRVLWDQEVFKDVLETAALTPLAPSYRHALLYCLERGAPTRPH